MRNILCVAFFVTAGCSPSTQSTPAPAQTSPATTEAAPSQPATTAPKKEYIFHGKVESVDPKAGMVSVTNEAIDGWMGAMTMMYRVDNKEVIDQLKAGTQITAKVYDGDLQTLYQVHVESAKPPAVPPVK